MKDVTARYGVDSITKQVEDDFTFGELQESDSFKAALGFGDNTKALVDGIEQHRSTVIPPGTTVRLETAAHQGLSACIAQAGLNLHRGESPSPAVCARGGLPVFKDHGTY
jgi:hypothetical protein